MEETTTIAPTQAVETPSPFAAGGWSEQLPEAKTEPVVQETTVEVTPQKEEEEILDPKDWLKREFEVDDPQVIKQYLKEYKELKEKPQVAAEYKFENEDSKRMAEAISKGDRKEILRILETQDRLERFTTSEVNDDTAADIIKLGMQLKYKDLSPSEIDYKYNKEFSIPKEPMQGVDELDEEFNARKAEWQDKVNDIKMNRNIEAKLAKPELEKLKSQIVLPELAKPATQEANQPTEAELKQIRDNFLAALDSNYNKVEGFNTMVKDESVEIPIAFKIPDDAKVAIKGRLVEGMDVNAYMDKRWFDEKGNAKVENIFYDQYILENLDKILSSVANNAASRRLEEYIKQSKNLNVNGSTHQTTFQPSNNGSMTQSSPFSNGAWSEKPPSFVTN